MPMLCQALSQSRARAMKSAVPMSASSARSSTCTRRGQSLRSNAAEPSRRQRANKADACPDIAEAAPTPSTPRTGATTGVEQEMRARKAPPCSAKASDSQRRETRQALPPRASRAAARVHARSTRLHGGEGGGEGCGGDSCVGGKRRRPPSQVGRERDGLTPRLSSSPDHLLRAPGLPHGLELGRGVPLHQQQQAALPGAKHRVYRCTCLRSTAPAEERGVPLVDRHYIDYASNSVPNI